MPNNLPIDLNFRLPAEWEPHESTWLSWPHNTETWTPEELERVYGPYSEFVSIISKGEKVNICVAGGMKDLAWQKCDKAGAVMSNVVFHDFPTNDAWMRDHGPDFLVSDDQKAIIDWTYNSWGEKYPPWDDDNLIPMQVGNHLDLPRYQPGIVLEGGSIECNGEGSLLTTTSCLLNKNRNPHLSQTEIEQILKNYFCVSQIIWLGEGISGDDTDGHIDDITRFAPRNKILTVRDASSGDAAALEENYQVLKSLTLANGKVPEIIDLPVPSVIQYKGEPLPASYANFYICNAAVIVPIFNDKNDDLACEIIQSCFPDRPVHGVYSKDIVIGLGSFHCLSKHEPKA